MSDLFQTAVLARIGCTAAWRRTMAEKYKDDPRNTRAADRLEELSTASAESVSRDTWATLAVPHKQTKVQNEITEAARAVGFRSFPDTLQDFLQEIAAKMAATTGGQS